MTVDLEALASSETFLGYDKAKQAAAIIWANHKNGGESSSLLAISETFEMLNFAKPNPSRLKDALVKSRLVRKAGVGAFLPTREAITEFDRDFDFETNVNSSFSPDGIVRPPFVLDGVINSLSTMIEFYSYLFLLENSLRGVIACRLLKKHGNGWWDIVASASMKRKHQERTEKELNNRWAPTRSDFGPLYSIDWPDLITLIRKEHDSFIDLLPDISFLHRFEDLGHFRNVVAHHGVLEDPSALDRVKLYYADWLRQTR